MTCRGHIRNGTIVLKEPTGLPDGAEVEVEVHAVSKRKMTVEELERLAKGIGYDHETLEKLREASKE